MPFIVDLYDLAETPPPSFLLAAALCRSGLHVVIMFSELGFGRIRVRVRLNMVFR